MNKYSISISQYLGYGRSEKDRPIAKMSKSKQFTIESNLDLEEFRLWLAHACGGKIQKAGRPKVTEI